MVNQVRNLGLNRPFYQKIFGRWIKMESARDWIVWARIRDKQLKQLKREERYVKHQNKS